MNRRPENREYHEREAYDRLERHASRLGFRRIRLRFLAGSLALGVSSSAVATPIVLHPGFLIEEHIRIDDGYIAPQFLRSGPGSALWPHDLYGVRWKPGEEMVRVYRMDAGDQALLFELDFGAAGTYSYVNDVGFDTTPGTACGDFLYLSRVEELVPALQGIYRAEPDGSRPDGFGPWWAFDEPNQVPLEMAFSTPVGAQTGDWIYLLDHNDVIHRRHCPDDVITTMTPPPSELVSDVRPTRMLQDPTGSFGGKLYLSHNPTPVSDNGILSADPATGDWDWLVDVVTENNGFNDLAFATGGAFGSDLYVSNTSLTTIDIYDPAGNGGLFALGFDFTEVNALTFSTDGTELYVADSNALWVIRPDGTNLDVDIDCCGTFACPGGSFVYQLTADNGTIENSNVRVTASGDGVPNGAQEIFFGVVSPGEERDWVLQLRLPSDQPSPCPTTLTLTAETFTIDGTLVAMDSCALSGVELTN